MTDEEWMETAQLLQERIEQLEKWVDGMKNEITDLRKFKAFAASRYPEIIGRYHQETGNVW